MRNSICRMISFQNPYHINRWVGMLEIEKLKISSYASNPFKFTDLKHW